MSKMMKHALSWAALGFYVFPVVQGGKKPCIFDWKHVATNDPEKIKGLWTKWPDANVGYYPAKSGHAGIDVDNKKGKPLFSDVWPYEPIIDKATGKQKIGRDKDGLQRWEKLCLQFTPLDIELPTLTVRTASGGLHILVRGVVRSRNSIMTDIDIKSDGGYLLAPGSVIWEQGKPIGEYEIERSGEIINMPEWVKDLCVTIEKERRERAGVEELDTDFAIKQATYWLKQAKPATYGQGGNDYTYKLACQVRDYGISEEKCFELMAEFWNDRCDPPWSLDDNDPPTEQMFPPVHNAYTYSRRSAGDRMAYADFGDPEKPDDFGRAGDAGWTKQENNRFNNFAKGHSKKSKKEWSKNEDPSKEEWQPFPKAKEPPPPPNFETGDSPLNPANWVLVHTEERFLHRFDRDLCMKIKVADGFFSEVMHGERIYDTVCIGQLPQVEQFLKVCFRPGLPQNCGTYFNTWTPSAIVPEQGDATVFADHLKLLFEDQWELAAKWMAWVVKYETEKPMFALLLHGLQGVGKSIIADTLKMIVGEQNCSQLRPADLKNHFNSWLRVTRLGIVDEVMSDEKNVMANTLKDYITGKRARIEAKGIDSTNGENCAAFILTTNYDDAINLENSDRRYLILSCKLTLEDILKARGADYFSRMVEWLKDPKSLSAVAWWLKEEVDVPLSFGLGKAPITKAHKMMHDAAQRGIASFLNDAKDDGREPLAGRLIFSFKEVLDLLPDSYKNGGKGVSPNTQVRRWLDANGYPIFVSKTGYEKHQIARKQLIRLFAGSAIGWQRYKDAEPRERLAAWLRESTEAPNRSGGSSAEADFEDEAPEV